MDRSESLVYMYSVYPGKLKVAAFCLTPCALAQLTYLRRERLELQAAAMSASGDSTPNGLVDEIWERPQGPSCWIS